MANVHNNIILAARKGMGHRQNFPILLPPGIVLAS